MELCEPLFELVTERVIDSRYVVREIIDDSIGISSASAVPALKDERNVYLEFFQEDDTGGMVWEAVDYSDWATIIKYGRVSVAYVVGQEYKKPGNNLRLFQYEKKEDHVRVFDFACSLFANSVDAFWKSDDETIVVAGPDGKINAEINFDTMFLVTPEYSGNFCFELVLM